MKRFFLVSCALVALPALAQAAELKAESLACMSQKWIKKYETHQAVGEEGFMQDMIDRAQCYVQKTSVKAAVIDSSGEYAKLELLGGNRVWVGVESVGSGSEAAEGSESQEGRADEGAISR